MVKFILGRTGTGKTTQIRRVLAEYVENGVGDIIMIVPEQFSFETQRAMLAALGNAAGQSVEVTSFSRLAGNVLENAGEVSANRINDAGRAVMMSMALEQTADSLRLFSKSARSSSVVSEMLRLSAELKKCAVTPAALTDAAMSTAKGLLQNKLRDVATIMSAYDALVAMRFEEERDSLTRAAEVLRGKGYFKNRIVAIDAFRGFTEQELLLIEIIAAEARDVYITMCTDEIYSSSEDLSVFAHVRKNAQRIAELAKKHGVAVGNHSKLKENHRFVNEALAAIEKGLYEPAAKPFELPTDNVTVCTARDAWAECDYVAMMSKKLLRENAYRCRDIAVISRSENGYSRAVKAAFRKYGVPVFEDKRQSIAVQPPVVLVRAVLGIAAGGFTADGMMRALKTGLMGFEIEEIAELENYAYLWQINGNRWLEEWQGSPNGLGNEPGEREIEYLKKINSLRVRATQPIEELRRSLSGNDGAEIAKNLFAFLEKNNVPQSLAALAEELLQTDEPALAAEQDRVWEILTDVFDQCAAALEGVKMSVRRFAELFNIIVNVQDMGGIPDGLDEIVVGSADRIRTSEPKCVFIVGASEGSFPLGSAAGGVFTRAERKLLAQQGLRVTQTGAEQLLEERFIAYNALCGASERLFLCYPCAGFDGGETSAGELVPQVLRLVPNCKKIDTAETDGLELVESEEPAFELCAKMWNDSSALSVALKEYFSGRENYFHRLSAVERAVENKPFKIENEQTATRLFGKTMNFSASRTESYYLCPFKYFMQYGIRARRPLVAELDAGIGGTVIHYVLQQLVKKYARQLTELDGEELKKEIAQLLDAYLEGSMGSNADRTKRFVYLYRSLSQAIIQVIERLKFELAESEFEPVDFELKIGDGGEVAAYEIPLEDGGKILVGGYADRVDIMKTPEKTFLRVVDYKTGNKKFELSDVMSGLNMQMLLYLFALTAGTTEKYGDVSPAGILYSPARAETSRMDRNTSQDKLEQEALKGGRMSGMVLNDARVVFGMERSGKGIVIPASADKNGSLKGNLISLSQLGRLKKKVDSLVADMGLSLHRGNIEALPAGGKNYEHTCEYCGFADVCARENGQPTRNTAAMSHEVCLKMLEGDEEDV